MKISNIESSLLIDLPAEMPSDMSDLTVSIDKIIIADDNDKPFSPRAPRSLGQCFLGKHLEDSRG